MTLCRTLHLEHKTDQCLRWGSLVSTEGEQNLTLLPHLLASLTASFLNLCVSTFISVKIKETFKVTLPKTVSARSPAETGDMQARGVLKGCGCSCGKATGILQRHNSKEETSPGDCLFRLWLKVPTGLSKQGGGGQGHPWHRTQRSAPLGVQTGEHRKAAQVA